MDQQNGPAASPPNSTREAAGIGPDTAGSVRDDGGPASVDALVAEAKNTMAQHGPVDALPLWQEIRQRFPHLPAGHLGYAVALMESGKLDEADGLLSESVHRFPDDLWTWIHYAQLAMSRVDWTEALRRWQEIRDRFPEDPAGYVGYAEALKELWRLDEAEGLLSESVHKFPDDPWAWIRYAQIAMRRGDWNAALNRCQRVRNRFYHDPAVKLLLAAPFEIQRRCLELLRLLAPNRAEGFHKARFGSAHDGGYVLIDDFDGIAAAFSFGIAQDANWDAAIADRGVPVYQFDHTIEATPISRPDLIFTKARIVAEPAQGGCTIDELVRRHGSPGQASLILKTDIEGDEWAVLDAASEEALSCFAQIVGEFHHFGSSMWESDGYEQVLRVFKKLTRNFGVVHVHACNVHPLSNVGNVMVPQILELTFANRRRYSLGATDEIFPGPLDGTNDASLPDIHLGRFMY